MPKRRLDPLPSVAFQIMLALADGELHGYAIMRQAVSTLLCFFQLKIGVQFSFQISIALSDMPPTHPSSPRPRATLRVPQLRSFASAANLRPRVLCDDFLRAGNIWTHDCGPAPCPT
jgi:hypothetical protein